MSAMAAILLILSVLCTSAYAYTQIKINSLIKCFSGSSLFAGAQLGKSVMDTHETLVEDVQPSEARSVFKRIPVGVGADERKKILHTRDYDSYLEIKSQVLSNMDKNQRQIRLMHGLTGDYWGTNEKLRRIAAAEHASLLPPKTATAVSIMSSNLRAGGLVPDEDGWVF